MANMIQMMQKASQLKSRMQELQARLQDVQNQGSAGSGLVNCTVDGRLLLTGITIDPTLLNADDKEVVEDLIVAAVNDAQRRAQDLMKSETENLMKELGLPSNLDLPF
jgi:DNA-binding YbaB/EbfC family protein